MKIFFALLLASVSIASSSAEGDTYVWNAETPIYYPTEVEGTQKIIKQSSNFEERKAIHSGDPNALFPRVLVFTDDRNYKKKKLDRLIALTKDVIIGINANFSAIKTDRPVEVLLAGLIIVKEPGLYNGSATGNMKDIALKSSELESLQTEYESQAAEVQQIEPLEACYRRAEPEVKAFGDWMEKNKDQFEDLNSHVHFFLSTCWLADNTVDIKNAHPVIGITDQTKEICKSKPVMLVTDSVPTSNVIYSMTFSYTLGVSDARDRPDFPYYTNYHYRMPDSKVKEWQEKFAEVINKNSRENVYSCFNSDDYDD